MNDKRKERGILRKKLFSICLIVMRLPCALAEYTYTTHLVFFFSESKLDNKNNSFTSSVRPNIKQLVSLRDFVRVK